MTGLAPAALIAGALACLLLALALWVFGRGRRRQQEQSVNRHLQRSLEGQRTQPPTAPAGMLPSAARPQPPQGTRPAVQWLQQRLGSASWGVTPRVLGILGAGAVAVALLAAGQAGLEAGLMALGLYALIFAFFIWRRITGRRQRLLSQLPGFLDNMVRLISIGNSPHAAFQMALGNVPAPLSEALHQAGAMLSASPDLGQAMGQLEKTWGLPEFGLLAAVFRMSVRYGGRADMVLERVSTYIRDRQSAERELHAMSAEIRLSAWVLAMLPIVVGALIMVLNPGYFMRMWNDDSGRQMILIAAGLEAFGALLLYRLARLK
ncbi:type II secretion system F family protein [Delftia sp. UME58]|uniref:type II secretion system F family protein n=1 Tax=Delftia sp. UME58 TaxID=1862322 RepID=UPI00160098E7|nr:type II secretion system F family protein [Delftia sp. UME58]MBB1648264.1 secretion system protein [Delftia sp. UME58]